MTFPYEMVYDDLTLRAIAAGLPKNTEHPPIMLVVFVGDGEIDSIEELPTEGLFDSPDSKAILGRLLQMSIPKLPANACMVMISEAYQRRTTVEADEDVAAARAKVPASLADDPLAEEVLLFNFYRPGEMRMGSLPILPGRILEYRPLNPAHMHASGRLAPETTPNGSRTTH